MAIFNGPAYCTPARLPPKARLNPPPLTKPPFGCNAVRGEELEMVLVTVFSPYGAHTHASTAGVSRALFFRTCEKVSSQNRPPPKTSSELCSLQSTVEKKTKDINKLYLM